MTTTKCTSCETPIVINEEQTRKDMCKRCNENMEAVDRIDLYSEQYYRSIDVSIVRRAAYDRWRTVFNKNTAEKAKARQTPYYLPNECLEDYHVNGVRRMPIWYKFKLNSEFGVKQPSGEWLSIEMGDWLVMEKDLVIVPMTVLDFIEKYTLPEDKYDKTAYKTSLDRTQWENVEEERNWKRILRLTEHTEELLEENPNLQSKFEYYAYLKQFNAKYRKIEEERDTYDQYLRDNNTIGLHDVTEQEGTKEYKKEYYGYGKTSACPVPDVPDVEKE